MQSICLLFSGRRGLDDSEKRISILRIPEVSRKLKEAQRLLDATLETETAVDLFSFMHGSDADFNSNLSLKSLVSATVQIGLFERLVKYRSRPQFLVGRVNGCSAMKVCAGFDTFENFVTLSRFCQENTLMARFANNGTQLTGVELEEYGCMSWNAEGHYQVLDSNSKEASGIIEEVTQQHMINQCIHVGPNYNFREQEFNEKGLDNLASMSSIDLDPILNSFWKSA